MGSDSNAPGDIMDGSGNLIATPAPAPIQVQAAVQPMTPQVPASDNWQERHAGLQRSVQQRLQETGWNALNAIPTKAEVDTLRAQAAQAPTLQQQVEALNLEKNSLTSNQSVTAQQMTELQAQVRKANILAEVAPDLAPLLGYVPTALDEEAQKLAIEKFRTQLQAAVKIPGGSVASGPNPPAAQPPMPQTPTNSGDLIRQIFQATEAKNWGEVKRLQDLWDNLPTTN